jgi:hypothetical protein
LVFRPQPPAQEEFRNTFGQRCGQLLDFPTLWGRQRLKLRMAIVISGIDAIER